MPKGMVLTGIFFFQVMTNGVERSVLDFFAGRACRTCLNLIDTEYFGSMRPADVRNHLIFCFALFNPNGFGDSLEQIHRRCCVQGKGIVIDHQIRFGGPLQIYPDPERVGGSELADFLQSGEIEKKKLFRKAKIFKQQAVARKRPLWIRQHAFIRLESHRLDIVRSDRHRLTFSPAVH